jgi:hypothetical protein
MMIQIHESGGEECHHDKRWLGECSKTFFFSYFAILRDIKVSKGTSENLEINLHHIELDRK